MAPENPVAVLYSLPPCRRLNARRKLRSAKLLLRHGKESAMTQTGQCPAMTPQAVAEALCGSTGRVVEAAVRAVTRGQSIDRVALLDEVKSELALAMLKGRFSRFDPARTSFAAYLAKTARNKAIDLLRHCAPRALSLSDASEPVPDLPDSENDSPDAGLARRESAEAVRQALNRVADRDPIGAAVLEARYLEGLGFAEIARRLGETSVKSLHVRAHRARQRLASELTSPGLETAEKNETSTDERRLAGANVA